MIAASQPLGIAHTPIAPRSRSLTPFLSALSASSLPPSLSTAARSPRLYSKSAIALVSDTETFAGGDVAYPIHEALNWHVTRFGYQARANLVRCPLAQCRWLHPGKPN